MICCRRIGTGTLLLALVAGFCPAAAAESERVLFRGSNLRLVPSGTFPSPLGPYFQGVLCGSPLPSGTPEIVSRWSLVDSLLYLERTEVGDEALPLRRLFGRKGRVPARWVSGVLRAESSGRSGGDSIFLWRLDGGHLVEMATASGYQEDRAPERLDSNFLRLREGWKRGIASVPETLGSGSGCSRKAARKWLAAVAASAERSAKQDVRRKVEAQHRETENLREFIARTPGCESFHQSFEILRTLRGRINSLPYSIYFMLRPLESKLVNSVWLWMPIGRDGLTCSFERFQAAYKACDARVSAIPWLSDWKSRSPDRTVEAHFLGDGIGENALTLEKEVVPIWIFAGLQGKPEFKLRLRKNHRAVATLYLSSSESRTLVTQLDPDPVLKGLALGAHRILLEPSQKVPEFALVDSEGTFTVNHRER